MAFVKIKSWHSIRTYTRFGSVLTLCGRSVNPPLDETWNSDTLPLDEKSCETCLRLRVNAELATAEV